MRYEKTGADFLQYYIKAHETSPLYGMYENLS